GLRVQFDLASARRANGMSIEWVDDARGRGLVIENPNAPPKVKPLSPAEAAEQRAAGAVTVVDVRPADERAVATLPGAFEHFDNGTAALEALPKDTALAFLCHRGGRSAQAAEHFRQLGFTRVYNITGGIDAWADIDSSIPKYWGSRLPPLLQALPAAAGVEPGLFLGRVDAAEGGVAVREAAELADRLAMARGVGQEGLVVGRLEQRHRAVL